MKKYKCIKKYPFGIAVGKSLYDSWAGKEGSLANFPEFWEEIVDPAYEILKFHDGHNEFYKASDGDFTINLTYFYTAEKLLARDDVKITSVKRLSDDKIFSIGDRVFYNYNTFTKWEIDNFLISHTEKNVLLVRSESNILFVEDLENLKKIEPVEFVTEDGETLTEKDEFWVVTTGTFKLVGNRSHTYPSFTRKRTDYLLFSKEEYAKIFISQNRPCLSIKDIENVIKNKECFDSPIIPELMKLVLKRIC